MVVDSYSSESIVVERQKAYFMNFISFQTMTVRTRISLGLFSVRLLSEGFGQRKTPEGTVSLTMCVFTVEIQLKFANRPFANYTE